MRHEFPQEVPTMSLAQIDHSPNTVCTQIEQSLA
jgi:hypothetical protein